MSDPSNGGAKNDDYDTESIIHGDMRGREGILCLRCFLFLIFVTCMAIFGTGEQNDFCHAAMPTR